MRSFLFSLALIIGVVSLPSGAAGQSTPVRDKNVEAQLISDQSTIVPGQPFTIGLKFTIDPTWHTYWFNPGETGKPTTLDLQLPEGFTAGELEFPVPKRFVTDFSISGIEILEAGFGYEGSVVHPITITPPADLKPGDSVTITGNSTWLMCDPETCVPGKADLSITLAVGEQSVRAPEAMVVDLYSKKVPEWKDWPVAVNLDGENLAITISTEEGAIPADSKLELFPFKTYVFDQLSEPEIARNGNDITFTFQKHEEVAETPDPFSALLILHDGPNKKGFYLSTDPDAGKIAEEAPATDSGSDLSSSGAEDSQALPFGGGLIGILFAAFLGGMILNIMPCVFPVISLKVMSFVGQAGEDRRKVLMHSIIFALGILIFFWILTVMMLILRSAGGGDVGWGAQLQQPLFVVGLIFVMVAVALSLFGTIEIGASMTAVGGNLTNKSGYSGSFWSGALAVLLATPCTAPLMAPAIGFALSQSAPIMFLVFTALGLGLAAPYFLFAAFPKLLDVIPAPGPWMETFKQFMGFPMLAVAIWLIGVLSKQLSVEGLQWSLASVLFLALAVWILGRFGGFDRTPPARLKARIAALLVFALSIGVAYKASGNRAPASNVDLREVIADHRAGGKHVFVDFTAEWCVTCKANEKATIKTEKVQNMFKDNNVEFVIADWTNEDPIITEVLKEHGRAGVPFYLLYPSDTSKEAISLGDGIITAGDIEAAIEKLSN